MGENTTTTSAIASTFAALGAAGRVALIPYITAGDPDLETTLAVMIALSDGGADIIELGVPFSDPMADGPVIEAAMVRALANGTTLAKVLTLARRFRATHATPIVLFGYLNPLYRAGLDTIAQAAADAGIDGFLVVDLPPEEAEQLTVHTRAAGRDFIALFTPTSDDARVAAIAAHASGFAYYVSMAGVTGDGLTELDSVAARVSAIRAATKLPVCVGFGIRTPDDATRVARFADGVVIGTGLVQALHDAGPEHVVEVARNFAARYRTAIDAR